MEKSLQFVVEFAIENIDLGPLGDLLMMSNNQKKMRYNATTLHLPFLFVYLNKNMYLCSQEMSRLKIKPTEPDKTDKK